MHRLTDHLRRARDDPDGKAEQSRPRIAVEGGDEQERRLEVGRVDDPRRHREQREASVAAHRGTQAGEAGNRLPQQAAPGEQPAQFRQPPPAEAYKMVKG